MSILESGNYYIYRHVTINDPHVFYIGLGSKTKQDLKFNTYTRAFRKDRSIEWRRVIDKYGYEVEILLETNDRAFCVEKEIEFIKLYGRRDRNKGTLINHTDGGEYGALGRIYKPSKESIEKMRNSMIGKKMPEGFGKSVSERMKGNKYRVGYAHSPEMKSIIAAKVRKIIYMYNLSGNFIQKFDSVKDAAERFSVDASTIICCAKGIQQQTQGYQFRYELLDNCGEVFYKIRKNVKIVHLNLSTNKTTVYNTIKEASIDLNINVRKIRHNLYGESNIVENNHKFSYLKEEEK